MITQLPATAADFCVGIHRCSEHSQLPSFPLTAAFSGFRKNTWQIYCMNSFEKQKMMQAIVEHHQACHNPFAAAALLAYCMCHLHFSASLTSLSLLLPFIATFTVLTVMVSSAVAAIYSDEFWRILRPDWLYKILYFSSSLSLSNAKFLYRCWQEYLDVCQYHLVAVRVVAGSHKNYQIVLQSPGSFVRS